MTASGTPTSANGPDSVPALVQDGAAQITADVVITRQASQALRIRSAQLRADSKSLRASRQVHRPHHHSDDIESRSPPTP
jgi:hypothetical protein